MSKIVGIGETVLDMVFIGNQPKAAVPGGSVFNSLVSLGRTLGDTDVVMISQCGDDHVARIMFDFMAVNGVKSDMIVRVPAHQSTVSLAILDDRGDASYEFLRDRTMPPFEAPDIEFFPDDIVIFGSFFAVDPATREQTRSIVRKARNAGAQVYYDINFRKNHIAQLEQLRGEIETNCSLATIVRGSSEDIMNLYGIGSGREAYESRISGLCPEFIYTRGGEPAEVFLRGEHKVYPVIPAEVVSTIGAGDNFNAGFVYGLVRGMDTDGCVETALRFSAAVCASVENYVPKDFSL